MSRYKPYPKYKASGVEWLGDMPEHWEKGLLSNLFTNNKEKNSGMFNNNLLSLSYGKIVNKDIETSFGLLPESFESYQIVHDGFIVLRLTDLQNDQKSLRTGFVTQTGIITSAYVGLKKKSKSIGNEKYFYLYLHAFDIFKGFYGMGSGVRQSLNYDELKKLQFILPPLNEQNSIVNFLDNATCKIDTLIQKQQNLIELLKEKRQALISHAVIKGLNPHVKMKDSGVAWLGEVPEHWEVKALKFIAELNPKKSEIQNKEDRDCSFVPMEKLKTGKIDLDLIKPISDVYDGYTYFSNNDILLAKVTPCFENRNIAIASNLCNEIGFGSSEIYVIRAYEKSDKKYLFYFLQEATFIELAVSQMTGVGGLKRIPSEFLANLKLPSPSFEEQQKISNYLDNATCKIDTVISKAQKIIELLKERRTALISATVTGKIDVREIA